MINPIKAIAVGVIVLFSHNALSSESQETVYSLISSISEKIYIIGETKGEDVNAYNKILNTGAEKTQQILSNKSYDIEKEPNEDGSTALHLAAEYGYYTIVEALLKDDRYVSLLTTKDKNGYTPLDVAKIRQHQVAPFINPALAYDSWAFISFMVNQGFYSSELKPYQKTIDILKSHNAASTCSLSECYKKILLKQLDSVNKHLDEEPYDAEFRKGINEIKSIVQKHLLMISENTSIPDSDLLAIITKDIEENLEQMQFEN